MQKIGATNDPKTHVLQPDVFGACNGFRQRRVVGKLYWRSLRPHPVFGMTEPPGAREAGRFKLCAGELAVSDHGHVDIKCCAGFRLVNLECDTADDGVIHFRLRKDPGQR